MLPCNISPHMPMERKPPHWDHCEEPQLPMESFTSFQPEFMSLATWKPGGPALVWPVVLTRLNEAIIQEERWLAACSMTFLPLLHSKWPRLGASRCVEDPVMEYCPRS